MTTKEKILEEAFTLFSEKGYKGTSVKDIANAVGIKDASLYKHYRSKEEILSAIMEKVTNRVQIQSEKWEMSNPEVINQNFSNPEQFSKEKFVELSIEAFMFYWKDRDMARFWKMGNMERYQNSEVDNLFQKFYMEDSISYQSSIFELMCDSGILKKVDKEMLAVSYFSPFYFLWNKYAGMYEKEEKVRQILKEHIMNFLENTMLID